MVQTAVIWPPECAIYALSVRACSFDCTFVPERPSLWVKHLLYAERQAGRQAGAATWRLPVHTIHTHFVNRSEYISTSCLARSIALGPAGGSGSEFPNQLIFYIAAKHERDVGWNFTVVCLVGGKQQEQQSVSAADDRGSGEHLTYPPT